jgi:hypothetical protein
VSIGAGDPLQPAGLAEYQSSGAKAAGAQPKPSASEAGTADTQKADRGVALKAAQARWSSRQKGNQKGK